MTVPLALQYGLIAVAVAVSAWVVLQKRMPGLARRLRIALALPLVRAGAPPWLSAIGRRIAPAPSMRSSDCGGCDGCNGSDGIGQR
ncbi:MAG: hypothetical protein E6Q88_10330 [Lysobacteraceae bacterium]|nr:MAG: hypothetical protein E6Q88_10330 [Xanthomonadaceae bacterium]